MSAPAAPNGAQAQAPGAQKPALPKFSHKFWAPEVRHLRLIYLKAVIPTIIITIFVMWVCLPVYWGSLAHQLSYSNKLHVEFINRDGGDIGNALQAAVAQQQQNTTHWKLGWRVTDPEKYPTDEEAIQAMLDEACWMVVIVPAGTTQSLISARASGNTSYDPNLAVQLYYSQARNENAANNYLQPYAEAFLGPVLTKIGANMTQQWLSSSAGNATALQAAAMAPMTISNPVWYTFYDQRPFSAMVATALLLVGSIYMIIFSFIVTMAGYAVRQPIEPFLTTSQLLRLRIIAPMILYIPLSFSYSMVSLAFKVPFGAHFGYGGGFFLWWIFVYMTMASLGLATEFAVQLLTPRFITFFLIPLIISNVSVASLPIQLEPWFYHYGYGFPVFNMSLATRTLIFNTKNHMGRNAGILVAWIVLSIITLSCVTLWQRRGHVRAHRAQMAGGVENGNGNGNGTMASEKPMREEKPRERESGTRTPDVDTEDGEEGVSDEVKRV